jgi:hypothetical protein
VRRRRRRRRMACRWQPGMAVQVEPMQSKLKAPGIERLKLNYDNPLSRFGFEYNCAATTWCSTGSGARGTTGRSAASGGARAAPSCADTRRRVTRPPRRRLGSHSRTHPRVTRPRTWSRQRWQCARRPCWQIRFWRGGPPTTQQRLHQWPG